MERTLRSYLVPSLLYALLLEAMIAAAIIYWPDFEENIDTYGDILPFESVRKMVESISDTGVAAYVNLQHFYKLATEVKAILRKIIHPRKGQQELKPKCSLILSRYF